MIDKVLNDLLQFAERAGALSASAVLSLVCIYLGWRNNKIEERNNEEADKRTELRIKDAEVNLLTVKAMEKQSDAIERIQIILDERLPGRRRDHV